VSSITPRALGMGDALRGYSVGAAALHFNPSGLVLEQRYTAEAAYSFRTTDSLNHIDVSVTDTVTARVGAGVYYRYLNADNDRSGSEGGLAIAVPLGSVFSFGFLPKLQSIGGPATGGTARGFNIDVGATIRPIELVSFGVVGSNLVNKDSIEAPRTVGIGGALRLSTFLLAGFDAVWDFDSARLRGQPDQVSARYHVGGEVTISTFALRVGYVRDQGIAHNHLTFGGGFVLPQFAFDFGTRKNLDGSWLFGIGIRAFLQ
jgi:hypothetical protein